jgi:hypothetical protein
MLGGLKVSPAIYLGVLEQAQRIKIIRKLTFSTAC